MTDQTNQLSAGGSIRHLAIKLIVLFYLFIKYNVVTFNVHPLCLHTPSPAVLPVFVAFLERSLWNIVYDLAHSPLDVFC
jgi:hypothetical protein